MPVTRKGQTEREVYLPVGQWVCWWSSRQFEGGQTIRVPVPLFEPCGLPVFVRAGAIIPRQEVQARLADEIPATLTLDVFPAGRSCFRCHEAADVTHEFVCESRHNGIILRLPNQTPRRREYVVRLHGVKAPGAVRQDGEPLPAARWSLDPSTGVVLLHVAVAPGTTATVSTG